MRAQEQSDGSTTPSRTLRPVVRGTRYAVSSMKLQATEAAVRILEAGGNAFDAAVAGQAVLALVNPESNGFGADAVVLVYDAREKKVHSINAEGTAPRLATIDWYNKNNGGRIPNSDGLLSASLPGVIDAWYIMLDRWGTMSFAQVLERAIDVAENGYPIGEGLSRAIAGSKKIQKYPTTMKVYFPNGRAPQPGELFRNPDSARMLRKLVDAEKAATGKGRREALRAARDRFYKGDIARTMGDFSEKNGGLYRYEDFAGYTAKVETPVSTTYRGYEVYKNTSSSQGPAELFMLNILEGYDLKTMGHNSPGYIHASAEALKLAFADREQLGDTDFVRIPFEGLLSKTYAAERRKLIDSNKVSLEIRPGNPERFMKATDPAGRVRGASVGEADYSEGDTSYIAVVDQDRNMVSFEPSLHSGFGTGVVMADLGFIFNCRGDYYSLTPGEPRSLEPGKRPRSTLQSTLVMKDGRPWMITGSPGGDDQIPRTVQTLLNMVDFGMNVQQAIEAPRWSTRSFASSVFPHRMSDPGHLSVESRVPEAVQKALLAKGHKLLASGAWSLGSNAAIVLDPKTGVLSAGADPRVEAYAWAR
ncbi:MAG: gamma-glutamyltransferase [Betaproteobacteria bacterium RIFCSPLOWO2_12_FULL_63_13]|nr:MAG: gamma-glutamyltransferase [Betaproteobacteria bacterium RIFCSPLOWO2_12_FULL_63_13]